MKFSFPIINSWPICCYPQLGFWLSVLLNDFSYSDSHFSACFCCSFPQLGFCVFGPMNFLFSILVSLSDCHRFPQLGFLSSLLLSVIFPSSSSPELQILCLLVSPFVSGVSVFVYIFLWDGLNNVRFRFSRNYNNCLFGISSCTAIDLSSSVSCLYYEVFDHHQKLLQW